MQVSALGMWAKRDRIAGAPRTRRPVIVVTHAPPREHQRRRRSAPIVGFTAFRWLADRLAPPLWLHGHTALVRRGIDARCAAAQRHALLQLHRRDAHRAASGPTPMDEPVPIRRAAVGCLLVAVIRGGHRAPRPAGHLHVAPPARRHGRDRRDRGGGGRRPDPARPVLSRSRGWSGERDAGDGRVQVAVIVAPTADSAASSPSTPPAPAAPIARSRSAPIGSPTATVAPGPSTGSRSTRPIRRSSGSRREVDLRLGRASTCRAPTHRMSSGHDRTRHGVQCKLRAAVNRRRTHA